ncbi:short chain dehydrogenase domain-containing protein [Phthorimaea operculella]|nr:short chain dehydrogenase domain-containing protein [Phthorimaea operculella]
MSAADVQDYLPGITQGPLTREIPECMRDKYTIVQAILDIIGFWIMIYTHLFTALYRSIVGYNKKELKGQVAVVTGGGGGLGSLIALRLARLGCIVVLWDINKQGLEDAVKLVKGIGGKCHGYVVDLTNRDDIYRVAKRTSEEVGRLVKGIGGKCHGYVVDLTNRDDIYRVAKITSEEVGRLVKGIGGQCHGYVVDLTNRDDIYRVAKRTSEEVGRSLKLHHKLVKGIGGKCHGYLVDLTNRDDIYRVAKRTSEEVGRLVKGVGGKCHGYVVDLTNRDDIYRVAKRTSEEVGRGVSSVLAYSLKLHHRRVASERHWLCHGYVVDLTNRDDIYRVAKRTSEEVGRVSILINNAGVVSGTYLLDTPDHLIQRTFDVNVLSHFWTVKAFLPQMIENSDGHIVTIASMAGQVGVAKLVDYCASKSAACGFDEALKIELETQGVKGVYTSLICPYFIRATGMFEQVDSR